MRPECRERFPRHRLQRQPLVGDPGMHHGMCVTHVPWCMSGSLTRGCGENVLGIPGVCATRKFTYLVRGPLVDRTDCSNHIMRPIHCYNRWWYHRKLVISGPWHFDMDTFSILLAFCADMMTNGNISALLAICAGNSPEFPAQRPVTRSFDVFFDLHPKKWLSKQSWGWWFEKPSRPLWRHCNGNLPFIQFRFPCQVNKSTCHIFKISFINIRSDELYFKSYFSNISQSLLHKSTARMNTYTHKNIQII